MGFLQLPAELQIHIFSYITPPELKVARAVCTQFRDNASVWLFRKVVACARYQAMGAFQRISENTVYGKYVKEIVFDGSTYQSWLAQSEFLYQREADRYPELKGVVSWERRTKFRRYKELFKEQVDILSGHVLLQTLARALEWQLPNVSSLVYSPKPHHIPLEKKVMKEVLPRGKNHHGFSHGGFHHLIGAIHVSQYTGFHSFTIEAQTMEYVGNLFHADVFEFIDPSHVDAGKFFFRNLTRVNIALLLEMDIGSLGPDEDRALRCLANMASLLSEAKDLEDLKLRFYPSHMYADPNRGGYGDTFPYNEPTSRYLGLGTTWSKLRSLELEGISAGEKELETLVARHTATLTLLRFGYCGLFFGKWSNIVDFVVFQTSLAAFTLHRVHEVQLGETLFVSMNDTDAERWNYEGHLVLTAEGERIFEEPTGKSVYAWRESD